MTLYWLVTWALLLLVLGLAISIAINKLPGFTKKRDFNQLQETYNIMDKGDDDIKTIKDTNVSPKDLEIINTAVLDANPKGFKEEFSLELTPPEEEMYEVPWGYGDNKIILLTKDPHWLFTYWEITNEKTEEVRTKYGENALLKSYPMLRVYDLTDNNNITHFDVKVNDYARNWYINVGRADRQYKVALGRMLPGGTFVDLVESNLAFTPKEKMSDLIDEKWPPIPGIDKYYEHFNFNEVLSSDEMAQIKEENQ